MSPELVRAGPMRKNRRSSGREPCGFLRVAKQLRGSPSEGAAAQPGTERPGTLRVPSSCEATPRITIGRRCRPTRDRAAGNPAGSFELRSNSADHHRKALPPNQGPSGREPCGFLRVAKQLRGSPSEGAAAQPGTERPGTLRVPSSCEATPRITIGRRCRPTRDRAAGNPAGSFELRSNSADHHRKALPPNQGVLTSAARSARQNGDSAPTCTGYLGTERKGSDRYGF